MKTLTGFPSAICWPRTEEPADLGGATAIPLEFIKAVARRSDSFTYASAEYKISPELDEDADEEDEELVDELDEELEELEVEELLEFELRR